MLKTFVVSLLSFSLLAVSSVAAEKPVAPAVAGAKSVAVALHPEYVIGYDDVLALHVWHEPELSSTVTVRPDGMISLALIGEVSVVGKTPAMVRDELLPLYKNYLKAPEVSVVVQDSRSQSFSILGEVARPGTYALSRSMTVLDALALAGGFRDFARKNRMFILRQAPDGARERIDVSYKKLIGTRGAQGKNPQLEVHDTLVIP